MKSARGGVKRAVESALVRGGASALARRRRSGQLTVLAYHNIVPGGQAAAGDRSLHLEQAAFGEQLDRLVETHDVLPLLQALDPTRAPGKRPLAAITFDDAYSGAITAGLTELRARRLPATVFVTPAFLDGQAFWWDMLADPATGLSPSLRGMALSQGRGLCAEVVALAAANGAAIHDMPAHARGASTDELHRALEYEQLTLAAHTWNHPNLVKLSSAELADELTRPREWLDRFRERVLPVMSYPYGLADIRVQRAAGDAGYDMAFMIDGGWTTPGTRERFAIPRLNVPAGVSTNGFVLRVAGLIQG